MKVADSAPRRPVLRYHGGKWRLAPWILSLFPERHTVYVESFGGAASVLMRKPRCYAEVYNDQWGEVVNVFRVLRCQRSAASLARDLMLTPFARAEFDEPINDESDPVERARKTLLRSFAGFGSAAVNGEHSTGFRKNTRRSSTIPAHDWARWPAEISSFVDRLQGVVIENRPALSVIAEHDSEQTLHYVDPPYPKSTRNTRRGNSAYRCDMTDDGHRELVELLHRVEGMVVLSGYACSLYDDELYAGWRRCIRHASADGGRVRTEVVWLNRAAASTL